MHGISRVLHYTLYFNFNIYFALSVGFLLLFLDPRKCTYEQKMIAEKHDLHVLMFVGREILQHEGKWLPFGRDCNRSWG
jgi:hypothetical protein